MLPNRLTAQLVEAWLSILQGLHQSSPPIEDGSIRTKSDSNPTPLRARCLSAQALAGRRIGEYPWRHLREDPGAFQRPEHPKEARGMCPGAFREEIDV